MDIEEAIEKARLEAKESRKRQREEEVARIKPQRDSPNEANILGQPSRLVNDHRSLTAVRKRKRTLDDSVGVPSLPPLFMSNTPVEAIRINQDRPVHRESLSNNENANDLRGTYAPPRKGPRGKVKATYATKVLVETRVSTKSSEWYSTVNMKEKFSRGDVQRVAYVKDVIHNCVTAVQNDGDSEKWFSQLRRLIHEMEFFPFLSAVIIKTSRILEEKGLPQIFDNKDGVQFPFDIRSDAENLYMRWIVGDFDPHLLRGIDTTQGQLQSGLKRTSHKLKRDYNLKKSANVVGTNNLFNGQWWPSRICALRDGAHGEQEAGIHGQMGKGAYSVVVAAGGYADEDGGMAIEYCGTASETSAPTKNTMLLLESYKNKNPVRVLRAENKKSKYAPPKGIRYDGLYNVVDKELLDEKTAMYRFSLRRILDQDPIRWQGVEQRPTSEELANMVKIRQLLGMMVG